MDTSPLSTKKDVREPLETEVKIKNLISERYLINFYNFYYSLQITWWISHNSFVYFMCNLIHSDKECNQQFKEQNGYFDDWNPNFFRPAYCDVKEVKLLNARGINSKGNN
jgi:hypothetical protein